MTLTLVEAINEAETKLERVLIDDEVLALGRMLEADKPIEEILEVLAAPVVLPTEEKTYRYEASGDGVLQIPEARAEEETTDDADSRSEREPAT